MFNSEKRLKKESVHTVKSILEESGNGRVY